MNLPPQYYTLQTLHQELISKSANNGYSANEIKLIIERANNLINELAVEYPSEEMKTAQATALTLLEKAHKQAESYRGDNDQAKREISSLNHMDVLQPAQEALDVFLHMSFPDKQ